jgi:hypothetical protein
MGKWFLFLCFSKDRKVDATKQLLDFILGCLFMWARSGFVLRAT